MFGIQRDYQGQPPGPVEQHYSRRILRDLIARAARHEERLPLLGLFVQVGNEKAIRAYEDEKFEKFSDPRPDAQTGILYQRMLLKLR
jgi:ribosomal protein S18 acetylase RimI-like enzyme